MPRKDQDSLDQDFTRMGETDDAQAEGKKSLGDQSTFGDAGSSISDLDDTSGVLEETGQIIDLADRYEIEGVIGQGGMGEVLRARDKRLNRPVAIKRIKSQIARSQQAVARFLTEAQAVAALNHYHIVQIHDYGRDQEGPFLIMELVAGQSLEQRLKEGPLELAEAVDIAARLCDALDFAHDAGIVHRDIKPANILLNERGEPKLTDFGLARQNTADHGQTTAGAVLGTIDFMPPEQRRDATQTDARSDLWSLAATLYQMVTGKSPKVIRLNDVPQALQDILSKALEDEKEDRYQTAREFQDALRASLIAKEPVQETAVDLGVGECPKCHAKNDLNRKFCRTPTCAAPLRVVCLNCEIELPVWDVICGECGANQETLADARRAELDTKREKAESLRSEYAFDESLAVAREVAAIDDDRLQHQKEWANSFLGEVESEKESEEQNAANHFAEAQKHREAYDYQAAIHAIESISEAMRTSDMSSLLQTILGEQEELDARRAELDTKREKAESLRSEYAFDESVAVAREVATIDDDRLQNQKEWAGTFITETETEKDHQTQNAADLYSEAQTHRKVYDYQAAIQAMESIPEAMRTSEMSSLLQTLFGEREELQELLRTIKGRVTRRDLDGLLEHVNRAVELQPNRADLLKLQSQLTERRENIIKRDAACEEAQELLAQGNSKDAFALVGKVQLQELTPSQEQLKQQLQEIVGAETELAAVVKEAKADGAIDPETVWEILPKVIDCLKLNAHHTAIRQLKEDLLARIARDPARHAACAGSEVLAELPAEEIVTLPPIHNSIGMDLKLIPPGEFMMGSPASEPGRKDDEIPHRVKIAQPFYLSVHEVTQDQYEKVMGKNSSDSKGANKPVETVSWNDAVTFCRKLSEEEGVDYRLPTEAEWEYACRAGTTTAYSFGNDVSGLGEYAWYGNNSGNTTHPVGELKPNAWGLYDMHGNVWEWCQDWYAQYENEKVLSDPIGPESGQYRVLRGGAFSSLPKLVRAANRHSNHPDSRYHTLGFRLARTYP